MFYKGMLRKCIAVLLVILTFVFNVSVGGAEKTARLRNCLENDHMYFVLTPDVLGKTSLKGRDDQFLAFTGIIRYSSVESNHKKVTVYGDNIGVEVDTSASSVIGMVGQLKLGDYVTVYGQVDGSEVDAEHLVINPEKAPEILSYVFYPDKAYDEVTVTDLARDGHVSFRLPASWDNEYVKGRLTNNDVNGYRFFLNAIYPQNLNYPENFYMFYFPYETYLDKVKKNMDSFDIEDIEELVIQNIMQPLSGDFKVDISTMTLSDGKKFDYCSTVYKPADGNDYRLEFLFKHDSKGFVCMLYLYYPNDYAVNHLQDVAYVVQTLQN